LIGRLGAGVVRERRRESPAKLLAVALLVSSPDFIELDAPMVKTAGIWVREDPRGARNPPVRSKRGTGVRDGVRSKGGGAVRRRPPACSVLVLPARHGLRERAQKKEGIGV